MATRRSDRLQHINKQRLDGYNDDIMMLLDNMRDTEIKSELDEFILARQLTNFIHAVWKYMMEANNQKFSKFCGKTLINSYHRYTALFIHTKLSDHKQLNKTLNRYLKLYEKIIGHGYEKMDDINEYCSICLEDIEQGVKTTCNHYFHKECIDTALQHNDKCPYCRSNM